MIVGALKGATQQEKHSYWQNYSEEKGEWGTPHLSPLPPLTFSQGLPLAKHIWKPVGEGAQVRRSARDLLPGGEAEKAG